ncbi:4-coumarate--CoA ligase [Angomonas deanei]|nr:4-coumarate--CoA ligase [Angomonas deanei]CAD2217583.1 AMP-binding enzyme/AMP-binding enzyme C-terminal domain containing protein, putative [Angomonas deanei]|eukprot:EPY37421.1 4-coumarate--CoA ligase [Angomonas deanei]
MMKYSLDKYVELMFKYKTTLNMVAPPILLSLVKNRHLFKDKDTSFLRAFNSGAASLDSELQKAAEQLFPSAVVVQGYGMTEMSPVISVPILDKNFKRTYGSVGSVIPDTEIRIVKVDDDQQTGADKSRGEDAGEGEEGEIWTRGPQLMKGYLNPEDNASTMQDGWYRTGDIGLIAEASSEIVITDRLKELIKYKGFQVSPAQLEGVILQHPWVHDCIVIGVNDPREASFEVPRALVVLKPDLPTKSAVRASDEIYRFVMSRSPPQKRLHGGVRIVESIPRNPAGKLLRRVARQQEAEFVKKENEEIYNDMKE